MFFLFCIGLQSYSDLPWFPWLSIPGSTMEVRIIMPFASRQRNANTNYWATGVACCQWGKNRVTIWYVKKWYWLHRYLLEFCYLSWWVSGFCWDLFGQIWGTLKAKDILLRDALSQAFHCPLVRFLGLSSQNLLFYNIQYTFVELELVALHVAYTKKAFIDQKWFIPCWTLPQCRRRGRKVEEWMLFSRVSREHSHMLQDRFSTTSTGLIKWL